MERVGRNGISSSSGSGSGASLSRDSIPSVSKQHLADEDNVESKSKLDRYFLESFEDFDVEDFDILMWWKMNFSRY